MERQSSELTTRRLRVRSNKLLPITSTDNHAALRSDQNAEACHEIGSSPPQCLHPEPIRLAARGLRRDTAVYQITSQTSSA